MPCDCADPAQNSGNDEFGIPIKQGAPLSSACERAHIMGAIPEVIRHPGFTLTAGGVTASKVSNGGISNMASFFKQRHGCYHDKNSQLPTTCE